MTPTATMYYDSTELVTDTTRAASDLARMLKARGLDHEIRLRADSRFIGRSPLLVIDGGGLWNTLGAAPVGV